MSTLRAIKKTLLVLLDYILPYRHFETRLFKSQLRHEKPVKNSWKVTFTVTLEAKVFHTLAGGNFLFKIMTVR